MTMAAAIENRTAEVKAGSRTSRIAGVDILPDLSQAETIWRSLEDQQQFSTAYQRFDFLNLWQRQVGEREGLLPFIVVAYDAGRCCCCRSHSNRDMAFSPLASWVASTPPSTWRCGTGSSPPTPPLTIWKR
jgi:hypothetical protein